jgi:hypothetical protein
MERKFQSSARCRGARQHGSDRGRTQAARCGAGAITAARKLLAAGRKRSRHGSDRGTEAIAARKRSRHESCTPRHEFVPETSVTSARTTQRTRHRREPLPAQIARNFGAKRKDRRQFCPPKFRLAPIFRAKRGPADLPSATCPLSGDTPHLSTALSIDRAVCRRPYLSTAPSVDGPIYRPRPH